MKTNMVQQFGPAKAGQLNQLLELMSKGALNGIMKSHGMTPGDLPSQKRKKKAAESSVAAPGPATSVKEPEPG